MTVTLDSTKFNMQMNALHDAFVGRGQMADAANIVRDEARRFVHQAIRFTPPKSLSQGRKAVARDITHAMTPLRENFFRNERVREMIREENTEGIESFLKNSKGWKGWRVEKFAPDLHTKVRDRRGRVQREKRVFILQLAKWKKYVREVQSRVGRMRAGWGPAAESLGLALQSWVRRHTVRSGFVLNNLGNGQLPSITIGNTTKGISQIRHVVQSALNARSEAMGRRARLVLSGYAKDVAAGLRVRRRTR